jgi:hypothetical protein
MDFFKLTLGLMFSGFVLNAMETKVLRKLSYSQAAEKEGLIFYVPLNREEMFAQVIEQVKNKGFRLEVRDLGAKRRGQILNRDHSVVLPVICTLESIPSKTLIASEIASDLELSKTRNGVNGFIIIVIPDDSNDLSAIYEEHRSNNPKNILIWRAKYSKNPLGYKWITDSDDEALQIPVYGWELSIVEKDVDELLEKVKAIGTLSKL